MFPGLITAHLTSDNKNTGFHTLLTISEASAVAGTACGCLGGTVGIGLNSAGGPLGDGLHGGGRGLGALIIVTCMLRSY